MATLDLLRQERRSLVARLRDLPVGNWERPSLCAKWTVRHVLAHLLTPYLVTAVGDSGAAQAGVPVAGIPVHGEVAAAGVDEGVLVADGPP